MVEEQIHIEAGEEFGPEGRWSVVSDPFTAPTHSLADKLITIA